MSARLKLAVDGGTVGMDKLALQLGGTRLTGKIALAPGDGGRRRIDAALSADELSVATVLGPLLDRRFGAASAAEAVLQGQTNPWPDEPFSAPVLDAFEGQIRLSCKRLTLTEGLGMERARLNVLLQPGKVEVKEIGGAALGGEVKADVTIEKMPAGANVRGSLGFGIALEEIPGPRPPKASGTARLDLKALKLDSQWRLEAKAPDGTGAAKPFPAVMVSYRAPVAALSSAELQIDTGALEQELAARKIEHDMEELERLRRLNEADPTRKPAEPPGPSHPPAGPVAPIPPFGHEVRPDAPG
jgi:hypothetical protein